MPTLFRGANPTSKERIGSIAPHGIVGATPPQFIRLPKAPLSMYGNDQFGDCVTAEESFAKNLDGVDIGYHKAVKWARRHWSLNGAGLWEVMTLMQTDGFYVGDFQYNDGPFKYVNFTNPAILRNAIVQGPVKLGVAADQLENVIQAYGIAKNGWVATGFTKDGNLDHCVSLCGYGPAAWLAQQLGVTLNVRTMDSSVPALACFTWSSIGIIDFPSMVNICGEAWLRVPTTIAKPIQGAK